MVYFLKYTVDSIYIKIFRTGSISEVRVRLIPLNMLQPSSDIFADHAFLNPFCYLIFMFICVMLSCLFLAFL